MIRRLLLGSSLSLTLLLLVLALPNARAQHYAGDSRNYFDYGEQFFSRVQQSADARRLEVTLNMSSPMFSFVRSERPQEIRRGAYYAIRDVYAELTERGNAQPLASKEIIDTLFVKNYDETTSKTLWHPMTEVIPVPELDTAHHYIFRIEIRDGVLSRLAVRPVINDLNLRPWRDQPRFTADSLSLGVSDIMLVDRFHLDGREAISNAFGASYPFSRDIQGAFSIAMSDSLGSMLSHDFKATLTITQLSRLADPGDTIPQERGSVSLSSGDLHPDSLFTNTGADSSLTYVLVKADTNLRTTGRRATVQFKLPGRMLEQGHYRLTLAVDVAGMKRSVSNNISLVWPNMPISLDDPRDAINPLVHVTTESDFKELQSGSRSELIKKLYAYWRNQDPTPETAFNERMAAFYQRVDYAYFNFATSHALDGAMTDRGKIYILYGPPSKIERELLPGESPVETWTYTNNVKRQFKFTDTGGRGEYKLVDMKNL